MQIQLVEVRCLRRWVCAAFTLALGSPTEPKVIGSNPIGCTSHPGRGHPEPGGLSLSRTGLASYGDADRERVGAAGGRRRRARPGDRGRVRGGLRLGLRAGPDRGRARRPGLGPGVRPGRPRRRDGDRARRPARRAGRPRRRSAGSSATSGAAGGIQISASHNPPEYNGLKFFQPERDGPRRRPRAGRCSTGSSAESSAGRPGTRSGRVRTLDDPDARAPRTRCSRPSTSRRSAAASSSSCSTPATARGAGWARRCSAALGCEPVVLGGDARRPLRPPARADRGEPAGVRRDRPGHRRGGRVRAGPRRRPAGDRRRDRPLHRRGADAGPGRLAPAGAGRRGRSC